MCAHVYVYMYTYTHAYIHTPMNCGMHMGGKLLGHAMEIVEKVLEKKLRKIVTMDDMQFGFMPAKGTIDAVFNLRGVQEEYLAKRRKLYMYLVDVEKALGRAARIVVEWAMRKKGIPEVLVRAVIGLYKGAKTKVKVGTHLSEDFEANVVVHQRSVLSPLLFAIVIDFATNEIKEATLQEILHADDLALMARTMTELQIKSTVHAAK